MAAASSDTNYRQTTANAVPICDYSGRAIHYEKLLLMESYHAPHRVSTTISLLITSVGNCSLIIN
jgi:hypothetical protein